MSLFNPRKNKSKWASGVIIGYKPEMNIDEKILEEATDAYIKQHARILFDSIHIVLASKNEDTRKERYKLAASHYGSLTKVCRFATKEQKAGIDLAEHGYLTMVEKYKHPYRETDLPPVRGYNKSTAKKDAFREVYGEAEGVHKKVIDCDLCYESLVVLNRSFKVESLPEMQGVKDIEEPRAVCKACIYSDLS